MKNSIIKYFKTLLSLVLVLTLVLSTVDMGGVVSAQAADVTSSVTDTKDGITFTKEAAWVGEDDKTAADNDAAQTTDDGKALAEIKLTVSGILSDSAPKASGKLDVVVLMDNSSSMLWVLSSSALVEEKYNAKKSVTEFVKGLFDAKKNNEELALSVALVTFANDASAASDLTEDNYVSTIDSIQASQENAKNVQAGLHVASEKLGEMRGNATDHTQIIVLISNGRATRSYEMQSRYEHSENPIGNYFLPSDDTIYRYVDRKPGLYYYYSYNGNGHLQIDSYDYDRGKTVEGYWSPLTRIDTWYDRTPNLNQSTVPLNTGGELTWNMAPAGYDYKTIIDNTVIFIGTNKNMDSAIMEAAAVKDAGTKIYTIAYSINNDTVAQDMLKNIASPNAATSTTDALTDVLNTIKEEIDVLVQGPTVTDMIPAYFDIVDSEDELKGKGITYKTNEDGTKTVNWKVVNGVKLADNTYSVTIKVAFDTSKLDAATVNETGTINSNAVLGTDNNDVEYTAKFICDHDPASGKNLTEITLGSPTLAVNTYKMTFVPAVLGMDNIEVPYVFANTETKVYIDYSSIIPANSEDGRDTYEFTGWYEDSAFSTLAPETTVSRYEPDSEDMNTEFTINADTTVYAGYDHTHLTQLTFANEAGEELGRDNLGNAVHIAGLFDSKSLYNAASTGNTASVSDLLSEAADLATLRETTLEDADPAHTYTFDGWQKVTGINEDGTYILDSTVQSREEILNSGTIGDADVMFCAHYVPEDAMVTVTFVDEGGAKLVATDGETTIESLKVIYGTSFVAEGSNLKALKDAAIAAAEAKADEKTRLEEENEGNDTYWIFIGWKADEGDEKTVSIPDTATTDLTFIASYSDAKMYQAVYHRDSNADSSVFFTDYVVPDENTTAPTTNPTKASVTVGYQTTTYTFDRWVDAEGANVSFPVAVNEEVIHFYPVWTENTTIYIPEIISPNPTVPTGAPTATPTVTPTPTAEPTATPALEDEDETDIETPDNPEGEPEEETEEVEPTEAPEEEVEVEEIETPEGDAEEELPKTGTAPLGIFYGIGAACIIIGGVIVLRFRRKEDEA